ncbi:type II toxin-antitoxin system RelE/ParE family toxin [Methylobacterium radiotolerans]|uniref:type II toxin-antitoxin system RelE/ParE family toxin n=1 Tax=Methylobacterium radiotolerans TaxID=31998 RepID=UPI000977E0B0|nr:type II toxin-antitoxin system RelE/ParE family toxin [Methylobacterium radiotolerans]
MKDVEFLGNSLAAIRSFPADAMQQAGYQIDRVQRGEDPNDWKPMTTVGPGVREIRVKEASGAFRVFYLASVEDRVLVLHAFQKKTEKTPKKDIELAQQRLKDWKAAQ